MLLLSAKAADTFPAAEHHRPLVRYKAANWANSAFHHYEVDK